MLTITVEQAADYLTSGYNHCPVCKDGAIDAGPVEIDGKYARQSVTCNECGYAWTDHYTLTDITED